MKLRVARLLDRWRRAVQPATPGDRPLHLGRRLTLVGAGVGSYLLFRLLSLAPGATEALYGRALGPALAWGLSHVSGIVPIPLIEGLVALFIVRQLVGAGRGSVAAFHRRRRWPNAVAAGALRLGADLGVVVTAFYVLWGFHYARPPLEARLGLASGADADADEVASLARELVQATNAAYLAVHGSEDAGRPTTLPDDLDPLFDALDRGWIHTTRRLALPAMAARRYGRPKTFMLDELVRHLGTNGMYSPFTGEALLVEMPAVWYPKSVGHEGAHQRGVAVEAEANFLGYFAAAYAPHPLARYSAYAFAQQQLLAVLFRADRQRTYVLMRERLPGVQRDLTDLYEFWQRYRTPVAEVGERVNDAFLKSNRVREGVLSYSRSTELFIAYARQAGRRLVPETPPR